MDDAEALLARTVARAASAWMRVPADTEAYRRLVAAISDYDDYRSPQLPFPDTRTRPGEGAGGEDGEVLDDLADTNPPTPLGEGVADLEHRLRGAARRQL